MIRTFLVLILFLLGSIVSAGFPETPGKKAEPSTEIGGASIGENLFIGAVPFEKGGPPCMSCHTISGIPFPGGGTLGPDLTGAYSKFGASGMNSILATLPFPTMTPIFGGQSLSLAEQQELVTFLKKTGVGPPVSMTLDIGLLGGAGFLLLMVLAWGISRNRLFTVRKELIEKGLRTRGNRS
jgi:hypothetical protein